MGAHYRSLFLLHSRLSVPFATIYFNPMSNCSNKYEIHLFSFVRMSLDSFFISKFNLVPITSEKSYPSGSRKSLGKRNAGKLSNIIIVGCNFRLNLHIHPHRFHKFQCEENGGEENVIFTIRLHICASILSHYLI